jgi:hypothetical protein
MSGTRFFRILTPRTPRVPNRVPTIFLAPCPEPVSRFCKIMSRQGLAILWPYPCPTTPCHVGTRGWDAGRQKIWNWFPAVEAR